MNLETACLDLKEPGVIDEKLIYSAIIEQGPTGEEGRLFKQQGIVYEEISNLRLDYSDILKIDHLWMMTGLTKLQLSNNKIEKIENLEALVNLTDLDLSFNLITKIENLDTLLKLEVLTLFQNKIDVLENLHHLTNLTVFSIGNNYLSSYDDILYMRNFKSLRSFNMAGNPICENENFNKFAIAYIPQLVYYEYRMVTKTQREEARELFLNDLVKIEREESERQLILIAKEKEEKQERKNAEAFVQFLGGSQLFDSMFEKDADCKTLLQIGEAVMNTYDEFKTNFTAVTAELHAFGLEQLEIRKAEIERYEKFVGEAKQRAFSDSRTITEEFLVQKTELLNRFRGILNAEKTEDDDSSDEAFVTFQMMNDSFKELCRRAWTVLLKKELTLFEGMEEVNGTFERTLTEMVNQFIEGSQGHFTYMRQLQNAFNESITDAANKFFTNYTVSSATKTSNDKDIPQDLVNMMQDKDTLINALSTSHDYHLLVIDQREDKLVTEIRTWLANLIEGLVTAEINRSRNAIIEINHFLDSQKDDLHDLIANRVGELLIPKELQETLLE